MGFVGTIRKVIDGGLEKLADAWKVVKEPFLVGSAALTLTAAGFLYSANKAEATQIAVIAREDGLYEVDANGQETPFNRVLNNPNSLCMDVNKNIFSLEMEENILYNRNVLMFDLEGNKTFLGEDYDLKGMTVVSSPIQQPLQTMSSMDFNGLKPLGEITIPSYVFTTGQDVDQYGFIKKYDISNGGWETTFSQYAATFGAMAQKDNILYLSKQNISYPQLYSYNLERVNELGYVPELFDNGLTEINKGKLAAQLKIDEDIIWKVNNTDDSNNAWIWIEDLNTKTKNVFMSSSDFVYGTSIDKNARIAISGEGDDKALWIADGDRILYERFVDFKGTPVSTYTGYIGMSVSTPMMQEYRNINGEWVQTYGVPLGGLENNMRTNGMPNSILDILVFDVSEQVVPEPGTLILGGLGLAGLAAYAGSKRKGSRNEKYDSGISDGEVHNIVSDEVAKMPAANYKTLSEN
jgi:hypothetical protein